VPEQVELEWPSAGRCMVAAFAKEKGLVATSSKLAPGGAKDAAAAAELYERACTVFRLLPACAEAGRLFLDGPGVAHDKARAAGLFKAACVEGVAGACAAMRRAGGSL
jgi:TPR repeat protein